MNDAINGSDNSPPTFAAAAASGPVLPIPMGKRALLVVAAPGEAKAVLAGAARTAGEPEPPAIDWRASPISARLDIVVTGVGKANAAAATALALDPSKHRMVVSLGVGGALPRAAGPGDDIANDPFLPIRSVVVADRSVYADEGVIVDGGSGFEPISDRGFAPNQELRSPAGDVEPADVGRACDSSLVEALRPLAAAVGTVATVSACSGTSASADAVAARTGAIAEAMEGAAVAFTAARLGVPAFVEVRVISNRTGADPGWDIAAALATLRTVASSL